MFKKVFYNLPSLILGTGAVFMYHILSSTIMNLVGKLTTVRAWFMEIYTFVSNGVAFVVLWNFIKSTLA